MSTPLVITRHIKAPPYDVWAMAFLVLLGTMTVIMNITICVIDMITVNKSSFSDITYDETIRPQILSQAELAAALIAVSLPSIRALVYYRREQSRVCEAQTGHSGDSAAALADEDMEEKQMRAKSDGSISFSEPEDHYGLVGRPQSCTVGPRPRRVSLDSQPGIMRRMSFEVTVQPSEYPLRNMPPRLSLQNTTCRAV